MKDKIIDRLISVKSIVTVCLTFVFCYLAIVGVVTAELFMAIFTVVIGFYFGTQKNKNTASTETKSE